MWKSVSEEEGGEMALMSWVGEFVLGAWAMPFVEAGAGKRVGLVLEEAWDEEEGEGRLDALEEVVFRIGDERLREVVEMGAEEMGWNREVEGRVTIRVEAC